MYYTSGKSIEQRRTDPDKVKEFLAEFTEEEIKEYGSWFDLSIHDPFETLAIKDLKDLADTPVPERIRGKIARLLEEREKAHEAEEAKREAAQTVTRIETHRAARVSHDYPYELEPASGTYYDQCTGQYVYWSHKQWCFGNYTMAKAAGCSDDQLNDAKTDNLVAYAGPVAGWQEVVLQINRSTRVLAIGKPEGLIKPRTDHCRTIDQFLKKALRNDQGQLRVLTDWLAGLVYEDFYSDKILVLVGEPEAAEAIQDIITVLCGCRERKMEKYLQGLTKFNANLIGYEHLTYDGRITLKVSRMLQQFFSAGRDIITPGFNQVEFNIPKLWQRISVSTEGDGLDRLRKMESHYIVLKLSPAKADMDAIYKEVDYFGNNLPDKTHFPSASFWYQLADHRIETFNLETEVKALPNHWEFTAGQFVASTRCPESPRVIGRSLLALTKGKNPLLTSRLKDGKVLYKKTAPEVYQIGVTLLHPLAPKCFIHED